MMLYVAGPIANYDLDERRGTFAAYAAALHEEKYETLVPLDYSPRCNGKCFGKKERENDPHARSCYLRWDLIRMLRDCQGVALIPGWELSVGAKKEIEVARHCEMEVQTVDEWIIRARSEALKRR